MITAAELTAMQATQNLAMPGTAVIQRATLSANGMGGFTETWAAIGTAIARLYPVPSRAISEMVSGEQVISFTRWAVTMPVGTSILAKDRLLISGRTFEVGEVNNSESWQTAVRCEVTAYNEELRT
jgi:head-tail adaptor